MMTQEELDERLKANPMPRMPVKPEELEKSDEEESSNLVKFVSSMIFIWCAAMLGTGFWGFMASGDRTKMCEYEQDYNKPGKCYQAFDPDERGCRSPWRRAEYIVPGYRVGCWLGMTGEEVIAKKEGV